MLLCSCLPPMHPTAALEASQVVIKGVENNGPTSVQVGGTIILLLEPQDANGVLSYNDLVASFSVTALVSGSALASSATVASGSTSRVFVTSTVAETVTVTLSQATCGTPVSTADPAINVDCSSTSIQLTFTPGTEQPVG